MNAYGGRIGYSNGSEDYERRFMELVAELEKQVYSRTSIEEARDRLSKDMADGGHWLFRGNEHEDGFSTRSNGFIKRYGSNVIW